VHDAIPEPASDPTNVIVTAWLYQPFESAGRSTDADVTVGGVESILNWRENGTDKFPSVAEQLSTSLLELKVFTAGQFESVAPVTEMETVTGLKYQPLLPGVPAVIK